MSYSFGPLGQPTQAVAIGSQLPLYGFAYFGDFQTKAMDVGNPGYENPADDNFYLVRTDHYTDPDGNDITQTFSIDAATWAVTVSPDTLTLPPGSAQQPSTYSDPYSSGAFQAAALAKFAALPWSTDGAATQPYNFDHSLVPDRNGAVGYFKVCSVRFKLMFFYEGSPALSTGILVKFRWRLAFFDTVGLGYSYGSEVTPGTNLGTVSDGKVTCDWQEVDYTELALDSVANIIGPSDTRYLLPELGVGVNLVGFTASKSNGGFYEFYTPQASDADINPVVNVYATATATTDPATAAGAVYSGSDSVGTAPDDDGHYPETNTFSDSVPFWARPILGEPGQNPTGEITRQKNLRVRDRARAQYANGLVMTLSGLIETSTVSAALSDYVDGCLASPRTPPPAPVWISGLVGPIVFSDDESEWGLGTNPAALPQTDTAFLLATNAVSRGEETLQMARSAFSLDSSNISYLNGVANEDPVSPTYNNVSLEFGWDEITQDLRTGAILSTTPGSATFNFSGDPAQPPQAATFYGPATAALPALNTRVYAANFRVSPAEVEFLERGPVYEISLG